MRVHQVMTPMDFPMITPQSAYEMLQEMAPPEWLGIVRRQTDAALAYEIAGLSRYRGTARRQRGAVGLTMRTIKRKVPPLAALSLPDVIARLTYLPRGLVLVTGDTG